MFTVKVHESLALGGNEYLYSAERIEVVYPGLVKAAGDAQGASNIYEAGIYLDPEHYPKPGEEENYEGPKRFSQHVILFGHDATRSGTERKGGKVWVMNEHGATVATYDL
jgi:hypothetical protein